MKQLFTIFLTIVFLNLSAQTSVNQVINGSDVPIFSDKVFFTGNEALSHLIANPNPLTTNLRNSSIFNEVVLGNTTYDLQSNACVQDRIIRGPNGEISATWTMSAQYAAAHTDRGSGYVFFDGTNWSTIPTTRIESSRCGWPTVLSTNSGKEIVISHNTDNSYFQMSHRSTLGAGNWTEQIISSLDSTTGLYRDLVWNRSAVGGLNGETIHVLGVTAPSGLSGTVFNGMDGALLYYRSVDGGANWDIVDLQLPSLDTNNFLRFGGDSYAIDAKGETVVVAYFNDWGDSFILKSNDNGNTWNRTTFIDFPVDRYAADDGFDLDSNGLFDMVYSTDNYGTVILDNNNIAHIFTGNMRYLDDDLADGGSSWFPLTNGLLYWNENMGQDTTPPSPHPNDTDLWYSDMPIVIAQARDINCDGIVAGYDSIGGYALYYASLASMPSASITQNGDIYVTFSAYTEDVDNGTQVFRHINAIRSTDGGSTWSEPIDITPRAMWNGQQECVFGSMIQEIKDDKLQILYQRDFEPGLATRGDEDIIDLNEIIYLEVDINSETWCTLYGCTDPTASNYNPNADCDNNCCEYAPSYISEFDEISDLEIYPNPTKSNTLISFKSNTKENISINLLNVLGESILTDKLLTNYGLNNYLIDVSGLKSAIYFLEIKTENKTYSKKLIVK